MFMLVNSIQEKNKNVRKDIFQRDLNCNIIEIFLNVEFLTVEFKKIVNFE